MSDRESASAALDDVARFTRWPGLLSVTLSVVLGPIAALVGQSVIYATNMWACGHNLRSTMHIVPALAIVVIVGAGVVGFSNWRAVGRGADDERGAAATRTRFLSIVGMAVSALSALIVLAQWAAIIVFPACARA